MTRLGLLIHFGIIHPLVCVFLGLEQIFRRPSRRL